MQNSFNIEVDKEANVELDAAIDSCSYLTFSFDNLKCSGTEETFCKEINTGETSETDQTFVKERYIEVTDETRDENDPISKLQIRAHTGTNWPIMPRQPYDRWNLNLLLVQLSKETTDEELAIIKFLMEGMDDFVSTIKVYDLLQARKFITMNDLLYLQMIMAVLRNDSLIAMVYKFAQSQNNVLHFDPPLTDLVICNSLVEVGVSGADFHRYSPTQLHELAFRIKQIVEAFIKFKRSPCSYRLVIPCCDGESFNDEIETDIEKIADSKSQEDRQVDCRRSKSRTYCCDIGMQTDEEFGDNVKSGNQKELERENTNLKKQLTEAVHRIQAQSTELRELKDKLVTMDATHRQLNCHRSSQEAEILHISENFYANGLDLKNTEYELNSLRKENDVLVMKSEKHNETLQNYEKAVKENRELKVEKTNTEIQMGILQRNIEELEEKLRIRIDEENSLIIGLRKELELTTASLLNVQNDKRLSELTMCLEQIASMSMTVKKVYGNYAPAHDQILPKQDELYRKALSGKIGRIYPQIYYSTAKR
ncbi:uncharacterized protein LOC132714437 [Ruditapes philippinarum]|uniref:uncharacterized protein LOC132714437 n=1 Tax=Ruditapes philippinarum TaxID=129788 RepID=UPI00295A7091|nr:uncharacterized protein LOC132714437 [Ruditapes philippinarum]